MEELKTKYLSCATEKDFLYFQQYAYGEIKKNESWKEFKDGFSEKLDTIQFANRLIEYSSLKIKKIIAETE